MNYTDLRNASKAIDNRIGEGTKKFGACCTCAHAIFRLFKHGREEGFCCFNSSEPIRLSSIDPIVDCTLYYDKLAPSLMEMSQMATIIEVKRKAGFLEDKEVVVSKPEDRKANSDVVETFEVE